MFCAVINCQGDRGAAGERGRKGEKGNMGDPGSPGDPVSSLIFPIMFPIEWVGL